MDPKCGKGMVFCPIKKKCIPDEEQRSKGAGRGMGRGQGKGPMGVPTKEDQLVDDILDGKYKQVKMTEQAIDMVDIILDTCEKVSEVNNLIDHVPKKEAGKILKSVRDELGEK